MESKENFVAVIAARSAENISDGRQRNIGELLAVEAKSFSSEVALCSYCTSSLPPVTLAPCSTASVCGIISFQFRASDWHASVDKYAIVRRIFVSGDVEFPGQEVGVVKEVFAGGDFDWRTLGSEILSGVRTFRSSSSRAPR